MRLSITEGQRDMQEVQGTGRSRCRLCSVGAAPPVDGYLFPLLCGTDRANTFIAPFPGRCSLCLRASVPNPAAARVRGSGGFSWKWSCALLGAGTGTASAGLGWLWELGESICRAIGLNLIYMSTRGGKTRSWHK